jgi:hypothetical protein
VPKYIVRDPIGKELWRGEAKYQVNALDSAYEKSSLLLADLMRLAGFTVEDEPKMVSVRVDDLKTLRELSRYADQNIEAFARIDAILAGKEDA